VLRTRLAGANDWVEYDGISNHKKLLDSNANFEEFDAFSAQLQKRNKGQTLRLYNPETHQWSIYLVDLDKGTLDLPPVIGQFSNLRALCLVEHLTEIRSNEAVVVGRRWKDLGSELDLRTFALTICPIATSI